MHGRWLTARRGDFLLELQTRPTVCRPFGVSDCTTRQQEVHEVGWLGKLLSSATPRRQDHVSMERDRPGCKDLL